MTRSLPPPDGRRRAAAVNGCLDALLGLLLLLLEGVIGAAVALQLALSHGGLGAPGPEKGAPPEPVGPPPTDWGPALALGGFAAVALLFALVLMRGGRPWAGGGQLVAGVVLCVAAVLTGVGEHGRAHPPAPAPSHTEDPGHSGHPCRSGGDDRECLDSGG
ncbi:DUF6234 family protein [Streptomyces sp. NPDC002225]|uniref:DUF6234 family protein n=1 Tax=Streptomyces sp. NPDC002225 TaxID=3154413 RepID=UPI00331BE55A